MTEAIVQSIESLADDIYSIYLSCEAGMTALPGQFVLFYPTDSAHLLPRPISVCLVDRERRLLRLVWRVVGYGTKELASARIGDSLRVMGPLGNGYPLEEADTARSIVLMGGGIGIPPLLELSRALRERNSAAKIYAVLGYRDASSNLFLAGEIGKYAETLIATEDGSAGNKGTVIEAAKIGGLKPDIIYACGPLPMLSAVKKWAAERNAKAFISLEEHMACGIGACLGCAVRTAAVNHHTKVHNARVCKDGPVFPAEAVQI